MPVRQAQALACGTSVVSTDTSYGPREILRCLGRGVPPVGDAAALGRAMVAALRGKRLLEPALQVRVANFSVEKAADTYVALFDKPATGRAR